MFGIRRPVAGIYCHRPSAPAGERAIGLRLLFHHHQSIMKSSGIHNKRWLSNSGSMMRK